MLFSKHFLHKVANPAFISALAPKLISDAGKPSNDGVNWTASPPKKTADEIKRSLATSFDELGLKELAESTRKAEFPSKLTPQVSWRGWGEPSGEYLGKMPMADTSMVIDFGPWSEHRTTRMLLGDKAFEKYWKYRTKARRDRAGGAYANVPDDQVPIMLKGSVGKTVTPLKDALDKSGTWDALHMHTLFPAPKRSLLFFNPISNKMFGASGVSTPDGFVVFKNKPWRRATALMHEGFPGHDSTYPLIDNNFEFSSSIRFPIEYLYSKYGQPGQEPIFYENTRYPEFSRAIKNANIATGDPSQNFNELVDKLEANRSKLKTPGNPLYGANDNTDVIDHLIETRSFLRRYDEDVRAGRIKKNPGVERLKEELDYVVPAADGGKTQQQQLQQVKQTVPWAQPYVSKHYA